MKRLAALLAVLVAVAHAAYGAAPREEDVRFLEYVLDDGVLADAVEAYATEGGATLLPLRATCELLGIAVTVDARGARGFVLRENRPFELDLARRTARIGEQTHTFDSDAVLVHDDDIYVDARVLGTWFPVTFVSDLFALRVEVKPREQLPMQRRRDRERRVRHWRVQRGLGTEDYRAIATPYRMWDLPTVDQTVRLSAEGSRVRAGYSTFSTGDLLFMESEAYLAGDDSDLLDEWRMTLRRRDASASIGGFLRASEVAIGHIFHPSSSLLSASTSAAPGMLLTNVPLHRATEFDRHSFHGSLPPGWDVELYQNDTLIDYQQATATGQYRFDQVPLLFGMNVFRLVFYGPQGQMRSEEHRFLLGDSLTRPGQVEYRLAASAESADVRRTTVQLSYGATRHLTTTAEFATLPTIAGERSFAKGGLRMFWSALFAYGDVAIDDAGHRAWEGGLQTRLLGVGLLVNRTTIGVGYASEALQPTGDPLVVRDRVRIDTAMKFATLRRIPLSIELERQQLASGAVRTLLQGRISGRYRGFAVSNRVMRTASYAHAAQIEGGLQLSRTRGRYGVRGEVLYTFAPARVTSANVTVERTIGPGYRLYGSIAQVLAGAGPTVTFGVEKSSGTFAAGAESTLAAAGQSRANVNVSAAFNQNPHDGGWAMSSRRLATYGAVAARVFVDRNRNDVFDAGDTPVEGVAFLINGVERAELTDADGIAQLSEIPPHAPVSVAISTRTLEDPQWDPAVPGVRLAPRPGVTAAVSFPLITTAEIEGTVTRIKSGSNKREPFAGAVVRITDASGAVVRETKTSYDGYYVISKVRPGRYSVAVAGSPELRPLVVTAEQELVAGVDFGLGGPAAAVVAAHEPSAHDQTTAEKHEAPKLETAGRYLVQLGAFTMRGNAEEMARKARTDLARIDARGKLFFVEVGPYRTRAEANAARTTFAARGLEAIVRPVRARQSTAVLSPVR